VHGVGNRHHQGLRNASGDNPLAELRVNASTAGATSAALVTKNMVWSLFGVPPVVSAVATEPQYVFGAATPGWHLHIEIKSEHVTDCRLRQALKSGKKQKHRS